MAEVRPIKVGPGDKLRWLEHVAFHPQASEFHARIAVAISNRVDKFTGVATIGQEWIAAKIGATGRGVRNAGDRMQALGFFEITRSKGRGLANAYRLILPPISLSEKRNDGSSFASEKRNDEAQKEECGSTKRGTTVPPLPNNYQNSSGRGSRRSGITQAIDAYIERPEAEAEAEAEASRNSDVLNDVRWPPIKRKLEDHLGHDIVRSWFSSVTIRSIDAAEIVIETSTKFFRSRLEAQYLDAILRAARAADPQCTATRVRVVVREAVREAAQ